ncbi:MAG: hypothetical protein OIF58_10875, partial [Cohaesibacter sp.]|nr:hypothetical protein [Cohaesibacter sp.]
LKKKKREKSRSFYSSSIQRVSKEKLEIYFPQYISSYCLTRVFHIRQNGATLSGTKFMYGSRES